MTFFAARWNSSRGSGMLIGMKGLMMHWLPGKVDPGLRRPSPISTQLDKWSRMQEAPLSAHLRMLLSGDQLVGGVWNDISSAKASNNAFQIMARRRRGLLNGSKQSAASSLADMTGLFPVSFMQMQSGVLGARTMMAFVIVWGVVWNVCKRVSYAMYLHIYQYTRISEPTCQP